MLVKQFLHYLLLSMVMVGIVIGTNRHNSRTAEVAAYYAAQLMEVHNQPSFLVDLAELPPSFISGQMYGQGLKDPGFEALATKLAKAQRTVWVMPEYNNSFPGVLKSFLDSFPFPNPLSGGRAAMVGVSAGTNGGANAMSHWADILNYVGIMVVPQRLRIYSLAKTWQNGTLQDGALAKILSQQMAALLAN